MTKDDPVEGPRELVTRCDCGFEARGPADEMVSAMQKHAGDVHNMAASREEILARARPA
jgi:predicted small metal-binding protein